MLKRLTIALASLALLTGCKPAAPTLPPPASQAKTDTLTFFVSGLECAACTESVRQSIYGLDGIQKVLMKEGLEGYANVTFAPEIATAQQIAQEACLHSPADAAPDWEAKDQLIIRILPLENPAPAPPRTARGWNPSQLTQALSQTSLTSTWITVE